MQRTQKRVIAMAIGVIVFLVIAAVVYQAGMARLEGKPRTFWDSLEWAAETLSTTGYGRDAQWAHPAMVLFVVAMQLVGVFLFFLIVPIVLIPFLEERFEERLPRRADEKLHDHVIVYRYGPAVETLLQRLAASGIAALVVETDEEAARAVADKGQPIVFSRTEEDVLDVCRLDAARAIVANGRDEENAAVILRARQTGFRGEIYAFVEEPAHRKPMELAGATAAYTPRHIIAAALAAHASDTLSPRLPGLDRFDGVQRRELRIAADSPIAGRTIREAALGVAVVGAWSRSRLVAHCPPDARIEAGTVLEVVGTQEALARAAAIAKVPLLRQSGPFLIAGFGEVGRKVHELLTDVGEEVRVVERRDAPGVDVTGDVLDTSVLMRAGLAEARALLLALDSDDSTLFATVIARDAVPDVTVIARVNHARNLDNIHRAGADYALSISGISGEMLSARLLGRTARVREERRRVTRVAGGEHVGRRIGDVTTAVIAIERGGVLVTAIDPSAIVTADDVLWVCGT